MTDRPPTRSAPLLAAVAVCFFATGCAGLIYEILWNRTLVLLMGNTAYALATLLTVFMGGLALGAWLGGRVAPGGRRALALYGVLEIALAVYCFVLPWLARGLCPITLREWPGRRSSSQNRE